jgi:hypothetical protein
VESIETLSARAVDTILLLAEAYKSDLDADLARFAPPPAKLSPRGPAPENSVSAKPGAMFALRAFKSSRPEKG